MVIQRQINYSNILIIHISKFYSQHFIFYHCKISLYNTALTYRVMKS